MLKYGACQVIAILPNGKALIEYRSLTNGKWREVTKADFSWMFKKPKVEKPAKR